MKQYSINNEITAERWGLEPKHYNYALHKKGFLIGRVERIQNDWHFCAHSKICLDQNDLSAIVHFLLQLEDQGDQLIVTKAPKSRDKGQ